MKEELISFETAKLAKEKGFDEMVYAYYTQSINNSFKKIHGKLKLFTTFEDNEALKLRKNLRGQPHIVLAPTQSLLQKWLREEHDLKVFCLWYDDAVSYPRWSIYIGHKYISGIKNYEKALEKGLQEALKLI